MDAEGIRNALRRQRSQVRILSGAPFLKMRYCRRLSTIFRCRKLNVTWLRDAKAAARIVARIRRMEKGNPGDSKSVGGSILEMRVDYGPGYRIYYVHRGAQIVILLCGGDKRTQQQDIKRAQTLAEMV